MAAEKVKIARHGDPPQSRWRAAGCEAGGALMK
jgi:hypothetical protein